MAQDSDSLPWDMPLTEGEQYMKNRLDMVPVGNGSEQQYIVDNRNYSAYVRGFTVPVKE